MYVYHFFFFKQKTAYEMRISDWSQTCALPIYYEAKLRKKIRTSGCAVGTVFGDLMEKIDGVVLPETEVRTSWLYALSKRINTTPSLYLEAGAIHGCVLRSEEHTSELQSLMRISYAVFCLKKKKQTDTEQTL